MSARHHFTSPDRARQLKTIAVGIVTLVFLVLAPRMAVPARSQSEPDVTSRITIPWAGVLNSDVEDIFVTGSIDIQVDSVSVNGALFTKLRSNISDTVAFGMTSRQDFLGVGSVMNSCSLPASSRAVGRFPVEVASTQRLVVTGAVSPLYEGLREAPLPLIYEVTLSGDGRVLGAQVRMGKTRFRDAASR